jgi:hypothetical protein
MKYVKLFESFTVQQTIDNIDDIAAYIPTHTSAVESKWILPNFNLDNILDDDQYNKYQSKIPQRGSLSNVTKSSYIRYYIIGFYELNKFFVAESDIRNRTKYYGLKFFVINFNQQDRLCKVVFFSEDDWDKLNKEETEEKEIPNQGRGYKDYFKSIEDNVNKLKDALEDGWKL